MLGWSKRGDDFISRNRIRKERHVNLAFDGSFISWIHIANHDNSKLPTDDANCCPSPSWSQELSVNAWNARFWTQKTRKFKPKVNNEQLSSWRRVKSEVNQLSSSLPVRNTSLYQLHDVSSPDDASFDWFICGQVGWWIIWDFRREYVLDEARSFEARYVSCIGMWIHSQIWNLTILPISADTFRIVNVILFL